MIATISTKMSSPESPYTVRFDFDNPFIPNPMPSAFKTPQEAIDGVGAGVVVYNYILPPGKVLRKPSERLNAIRKW